MRRLRRASQMSGLLLLASVFVGVAARAETPLPVSIGSVVYEVIQAGSPGVQLETSRVDLSAPPEPISVSGAGDVWSASASFAPTPLPVLRVEAASSARDINVTAIGYADYFFQAVGTGDGLVPVRMRGLLEAGLSPNTGFHGNNDVISRLSVTRVSDRETISQGGIAVFNSNGFGDAKTIDTTFSVQANTAYRVFMYAAVRLSGYSDDTESGSIDRSGYAMVDPYLEIDPLFADRYALQINEGFGNTPPTAAVPEPGAWAMMLLGFTTVGAFVRRRRRLAVGLVGSRPVSG